MIRFDELFDEAMQVQGALVDVEAVVADDPHTGGWARPGAKTLLALLAQHGRPWAYVTTGSAQEAALAVWTAGLPTGRIIALGEALPTATWEAASSLGLDPRRTAAVLQPGSLASAAVLVGLIPVTLPGRRPARPKNTSWRERLALRLAEWQLRGLSTTYVQLRRLETVGEPVEAARR